MKSLLKLSAAIIFLVVFTATIQTASAQEKKPAKELITKNIVDSQQFVFHAQYVTPMTGQQRYLTSEYIVSVLKDTIICDLPYFGQAYSAPINASDAGIKFTSTNFGYKSAPAKKGGWDIVIQPMDSRDVQSLSFNIFSNGNAVLNVTSNNRQPISFSGYIAEKKSK